MVASLAGDVEVEEAAEYLYQNGIPSYAYSTELPGRGCSGAKYKWGGAARGCCRRKSSLRGAKRRSNPSFPGRRDGLLRFARNDGLESIGSLHHAPTNRARNVIRRKAIGCTRGGRGLMARDGGVQSVDRAPADHRDAGRGR